MFPIGIMTISIRTTKDLGEAIRKVRKALGVTQDQLALTSGANRRFIIELENGKPTTQTAKVLQVLRTLGIDVTLVPPAGAKKSGPLAIEKPADGPAT